MLLGRKQKSLKKMHLYDELRQEDFEKKLNRNIENNFREKFEILEECFDKPTKAILLRFLNMLAEEAKNIIKNKKQ